MAWRAVVGAVIGTFILSVYLLVSGPTTETLSGTATNSSAVQALGYGGVIGQIKFITLVGFPTLIMGGFVLWIFASGVNIERFLGGGRR